MKQDSEHDYQLQFFMEFNITNSSIIVPPTYSACRGYQRDQKDFPVGYDLIQVFLTCELYNLEQIVAPKKLYTLTKSRIEEANNLY